MVVSNLHTMKFGGIWVSSGESMRYALDEGPKPLEASCQEKATLAQPQIC